MKGTILFLCAFLLAGCSPQQAPDSGTATYFVSIPPQAGILKALVADHVDIRTLVGEGQSPHSYEPTARQLAALGEADALFTIGVPFESALLKKIRPIYPDLPVIETDRQIEKRSMPHAHHGEDCTHDHGQQDPHVWLSAGHATSIAANMFQALKKNGQADKEKYDLFIQTMERVHQETADKLAPYKGERFYVFHPSFGYFADEYSLAQVAIELDGKSPSPRQLADLIEMANVDEVKVIFVQKQFPMESARTVANAIDGSVVQLDPLAEDVAANLELIADAIADSYK